MANRNLRPVLTRRVYDAGALRITGTTKVTGTPQTPVRRRVRLHEQETGRPVADVWSDAVTGAFVFSNLAFKTYYVVTFDYTLQYKGEVQTDVTPTALLFESGEVT